MATIQSGPALNTILAALRVYQQALGMNGDEPPADVSDIATLHGAEEAMSSEQIDELCENLNDEATLTTIQADMKALILGMREVLGRMGAVEGLWMLQTIEQANHVLNSVELLGHAMTADATPA